MDYITQYYKNLSEQLQQRVDNLKKQKALYENMLQPPSGTGNSTNTLTAPQQPGSAVSGKLPTMTQEFSKVEGPSRGEAHWYNKPINPFSAGDSYDQNSFNSRYAYIVANFANMSYTSIVAMLANMMAGAPGNMSGQQFLALFPQNIQSWLITNYNTVYQQYYNATHD